MHPASYAIIYLEAPPTLLQINHIEMIGMQGFSQLICQKKHLQYLSQAALQGATLNWKLLHNFGMAIIITNKAGETNIAKHVSFIKKGKERKGKVVVRLLIESDDKFEIVHCRSPNTILQCNPIYIYMTVSLWAHCYLSVPFIKWPRYVRPFHHFLKSLLTFVLSMTLTLDQYFHSLHFSQFALKRFLKNLEPKDKLLKYFMPLQKDIQYLKDQHIKKGKLS